ncbi:hypothetical protein GCM10028787_31320 [Brachybacterium horti]
MAIQKAELHVDDAEVEEASRVWVESGPGAAHWELVTTEQQDRIRERMRRSILAGKRVRR